MTTPITFRQAAQAAGDTLLNRDKAKLQWSKMNFDDMPPDIQALAVKALNASVLARLAKDNLQVALDDKVEAPSGKRLIVTLGRDVSSSTDSVLVAWANATSSGTKSISFAEFIATK